MPEQSSLHETHARSGAVFTSEYDWLLPAHFGAPAAEYGQTRASAGLFDVSHRGKVRAAGADAAGFLHNLCTNDVSRLAEGAGCEAFLTTGQAKVVGHALIYKQAAADGPVLWLDIGPGQAEKVVNHLEHYHITEDVELTDQTRAFAQVHLAGPQADLILKKAFDPSSELAELQHTTVERGEGPVIQIRRHDALGLPGYDLVVPAEQAERIWQTLRDADARPAGLDAYHILRIEAGMPIYGVDIDETNLPQEVGRTEQAVSFTKGCYIGQETVARIRTYGHVNRSLVGLKVGGEGPVAGGAKLLHQGKEVGRITSSAVSPRLGGTIALGYVRRGSEVPGTLLDVDDGGRQAEVAALPFP